MGMKITAQDREQDEAILAAILAASKTVRRKILPHYNSCETELGVESGYIVGSQNGFGLKRGRSRGPCCAVGAGVLFAGLTRQELDDHDDALESFARAYDVTYQYATGVSEGFEDKLYDTENWTDESRSRHWHRGYAVGAAVREALYAKDASDTAP